jgi:hypothetical protein
LEKVSFVGRSVLFFFTFDMLDAFFWIVLKCAMNSSGNRFDRVVLFSLFVFQALLCYNFYAREIAWYPPSNFDQTGYLTASYRIEEQIFTQGLGELVRALGGKYSTGVLLPIEGALAGLFIKGGRLPRLFILFLTFYALQVTAFYTGRTVWKNRAYGYMLLGLILCQLTPWYWAGGIFDFRMDLSAYCLYGIWVCTAIRSDLFLDRRWAIGSGLAGAFLVLHRFLTIVYLLGGIIGFAVFCVGVGYLWRADKNFTERTRSRLKNLALSVGVLGVVVIPFFVRSWPAIYEYYTSAHLWVSKERAHQMGNDSLADHLLFYPKSILHDNWGTIFLLGSAIAILSSLIARRLARNHTSAVKTETRQEELFLLQLFFLLGTILWPIIALTIDTDKSPIVSGIVGVPSAMLVILIATRVASSLHEFESSRAGRFVFATSIVIFALGGANVLVNLSSHWREYTQRQDLERLVELDDWLVEYARNHRWISPAISFDVLSPWLNAGGITATGYEHLGQLVGFQVKLGNGIMGVDRSEALSLLADSDFLILTTASQTGVGNNGLSLEASSPAIQRMPMLRFRLFPFYRRLAQYRSDLKNWADKKMTLARTVEFDNFTAAVYVRSTSGLPSPSPLSPK